MVRPVIELINRYDAGKFPKGESYIILSSNENPYPPAEDVLKAIERSIKKVTNRYPDPEYPELKRAIAEYLEVDVNEIFLGNGISDCIYNICNALLDTLDKVTIPMPSYTMYAMYSIVRDASINYRIYPYYKIDIEDFIESVRNSKLVFLCSPNNPTGNAIPIKRIKEIVESVRGYVALDEAYVEFSDASAIKLTDTYENLIVMRTFSKFFGLAGLRIGYGICKDERVVSALEKIRLPFCINYIGAIAGVEAIKCLDYYKKIRDIIVKERERVYRELSKFEEIEVFPSKANFLLVKSENLRLAEKLEKRKILVRDVTGLMGLSGEHVRITIGKPEENNALLNALEEILS
ncbi:histidinol-phosphate transaminase [Archaeoglobus profundus]|uniref:Histidinol-phosphate aminotransferase n=1 Tax=Archaeoglobus profundus (strain DSM 5631 / JCM 9629 / NBRC 100127 / Av18) TaxID=572546 RepID=D2RHE1_ARCPA|nr:histidinol-phosphate transaminase [Archaeoglobus profundus]ADB57716.1 histidinol-phosphate aminotransferase [Archaeoglobus profundus DSM 5631]